MAKTLTTVGGGVLASKLNFRLCYNFSLNSKKTKRKGFSVAEAMIALLIGSLALGMAAPMITKQIKAQNMSDIQNRVLMQKIRELEEQIMPEGMIRFFYDRECPNGWTPVPDLDGRYIRLTSDVEEIGTIYEASLPNIKGGFPGSGQFYGGVKPSQYTEEDSTEVANGLVKPNDGISGAFYRLNQSDQTKYGVVSGNSGERDDYFVFDAHNYNPIYGAEEAQIAKLPDATDEEKTYARNEVRPRTITFIACIRNE